jgi:aspartate aminotransferase
VKIAERMNRIKPSSTMAISAKTNEMIAKGISVIDLGLGQPEFPTPDVAANAGIRAITEGYTKYTQTAGANDLKDAIIEKMKNDHQLIYDRKEVIVSCGAKHTLYNIAQVLFEAGDEVIIPAPYWVTYPDQVLLNDATPVIVKTHEADRFLLTPDQLKKAITPRTKAIIFNSPSNPTGSVYAKKHYEAIAELLEAASLYVISDEIYEKFIYDGETYTSIASLSSDLKAKTLVVNGVSKSYSMTGWRIGYAAGPKAVIEAMSTLQSQTTSNPTSISQKAALAALKEGAPFIDNMVSEYHMRRNLMVSGLNAIEGISCPTPAGSFYVFPNVTGLLGEKLGLDSSAKIAEYFLNDFAVSTVPGEPFGMEGYLRLSYAASKEGLVEGIRRIKNAVLSLGHL